MGGREDGNGGSMLEIVDVAAVLAGGVGFGGHDSNNDRKLRERRKRGRKLRSLFERIIYIKLMTHLSTRRVRAYVHVASRLRVTQLVRTLGGTLAISNSDLL